MSTQAVDDLRAVSALACDALLTVVDADWSVPAPGLTWTCLETIEHLADDYFAYAAQLTARVPPRDTYVKIAFTASREAAPQSTIHLEDGGSNADLVLVLDACAGLLAAAATVASPETRAGHPFGVADPAGFAAMGVTETVAHVHDIAGPLGFDWSPDEALIRRNLDRLFPEAPVDRPAWQTLLWATGCGDLDGYERLEGWRWYANVR